MLLYQAILKAVLQLIIIASLIAVCKPPGTIAVKPEVAVCQVKIEMPATHFAFTNCAAKSKDKVNRGNGFFILIELKLGININLLRQRKLKCLCTLFFKEYFKPKYYQQSSRVGK
jgi:hypothetical protein